jgi:hypothetical protein
MSVPNTYKLWKILITYVWNKKKVISTVDMLWKVPAYFRHDALWPNFLLTYSMEQSPSWEANQWTLQLVKNFDSWVILNMCFLRRGVVSNSPNPQAGGPPIAAVRCCLFNLFTATLHIGGRSSIRNLRTRHAVVTGTHIPNFYEFKLILDVHELVHRDTTMKIMNKMQLYRLIYYCKPAIHVSGDVFAHHQEHMTVFTVSGSVHPSCCRLPLGEHYKIL